MIRLAFVAVFAFAAGVLVRDQAQDYLPQAQACKRLATAVAHVLNGGAIYTQDVVASCRIRNIPQEIL